jgi:hypothetical protein
MNAPSISFTQQYIGAVNFQRNQPSLHNLWSYRRREFVNESGREFVNPEKKDRIYMMQYIIFVELGRAGKGPLVGWRFKKISDRKK